MSLAMLKKRITNSFFFLLLFNSLFAQKTVVSGIVTDAKTSDPVPFATVFFDESGTATTTDGSGYYKLESDKGYTKLKVMVIGYKPASKEVISGKEQQLNFKLQAEAKQLGEVTVKAQRSKYRNKDNPAVELIRKVIDHKSENRNESYDYYEYEKYEKIQFALSNVTEKFQNRKAFKKFQFVFENLDTTKLEGKPVLPVYMKESIADVRYRKSPKERKEIVKANKTVAFEGYVDNQGMDA